MKPLSSSFPLAPLSTALTLASARVRPNRSARLGPKLAESHAVPGAGQVAGASSYGMALSADGLRAIVETDRPGGRGGRDIFLLRRATVQESFTSYGPMGFCTDYDEGGGTLGPVATGGYYFSTNRPGGAGGYDLYKAYEYTTGGAIPSTYLNSPSDDTGPSVSADGFECFFTSNRPGSLGGKRHLALDPRVAERRLGTAGGGHRIDSQNHEQSPSLSDDGLTLFFSSNRGGNFDIFAAARATRQSQFGAPVRIAALSGPNPEIAINLAPQDTESFVTVRVNGRAVILSAARGSGDGPGALGASLAAAEQVAPGEILSLHLRAPIGHYGIVVLDAPIAPVQLGIGELRVDPSAVMVLDAGVQTDEVRLVQTLLPEDPQLRSLTIALQGLSGPPPQLTLTNAVLTTVR